MASTVQRCAQLLSAQMSRPTPLLKLSPQFRYSSCSNSNSRTSICRRNGDEVDRLLSHANKSPESGSLLLPPLPPIHSIRHHHHRSIDHQSIKHPHHPFLAQQPSMLFSTSFSRGGLFSQKEKKGSTEDPSSSEETGSSEASADAEEMAEKELAAALKSAEERIAKMEAESKKLGEEKNELRDKYQRSLAETENVRNRMQKQIADAKIFGIQGFCKDLLEVADILEKAVEATPKDNMESNQELKHLFDGLTMTGSQLLKVFGKHGLVAVDPAVGEKFDPNLHEALFQLPSPDKDHNTVAVVTQKGFALNGRTLRAAKVGVVQNNT